MRHRRRIRMLALAAMAVLTAGGLHAVGLARTLIFLTVAALHVCKPFQALNVLALRARIAETLDIAYAPGVRHRLDVYRPAGSAGGLPVVVFFYGGGWETGEKGTYRFVGASLAERGLVVMIPNYRLYPAVRFPAFEQDAAAAVSWARNHAAEFGGDKRRLFLMGHSAGAQIAALLALDPEYLAAKGLSPRDLCGIIGLAGPYDFLLPDRRMRAIFGPRAEWPRSRPINYVSARAPPMLLLAGRDDGTVDPHSSQRLAARLRLGGGDAESRLYPGITHTAIIASIADPLSFLAPTAKATADFVRQGGACGEAVAGAMAR